MESFSFDIKDPETRFSCNPTPNPLRHHATRDLTRYTWVTLNRIPLGL